MNQRQELAIRALRNMMGDNTARARAAFRNRTPEQMQEQYGQSGQTCAQILAEYEEHDAEVQAAIDWAISNALDRVSEAERLRSAARRHG